MPEMVSEIVGFGGDFKEEKGVVAYEKESV